MAVKSEKRVAVFSVNRDVDREFHRVCNALDMSESETIQNLMEEFIEKMSVLEETWEDNDEEA